MPDNIDFGKIKTVRTYQSDVIEASRNPKTSLLGIAVKASNERKKIENNTVLTKTPKNIRTLVISISLILISISGVYFAYSATQKKPVAVSEIKVPSFIFTDSQLEIYIEKLNRESVLSLIKLKNIETSVPLSSVVQFYFTQGQVEQKSLINTQDFLIKSLDARVPLSFLRFLEPDFMFGLYSSVGGNVPFIILKVNSFEYAFANMLNWEKDMEDDLLKIFTPDAIRSETKRVFRDIILENKDVRAVFDENKKMLLAYTFYDKSTIIIFKDTNAFKEILSRIQIAALKKS